MARIRSVHPSLFTDESWVSCSPLTRILYIGLWTDADDQGVFEWKPLQIKMRLLPGDTGDVAAMLSELEGVGLVQSYSVDGKRYGAIANFRKFQRPQKPNAIHPLPENIAEYVCLSATVPDPVEDQSRTVPVIPPQMEDGGWKGKGTTVAIAPVVERSPAVAKGGHALPEGWSPDPDDFLKALDLIGPERAATELEKFSDYWRAVPGAKGRKLDWSATYRNWIRRTAESAPRNARSSDNRADARSVWADIIADSDGPRTGPSEPLRLAG